MRLDSYLVEIGNISSRSRAKIAINEGHVKVNGKVITKASFDVCYSDSIEITEGLDKPAGYWKLKDIQEQTNLIKAGDMVLDIGSSAGGFLLFASRIAKHVHGIEFSNEFRTELEKITHEHPNVSIEFNDVFTIVPENEKYDVLLLDITVSPTSSLQALLNVLPALKRGGILFQVIKSPEKMELEKILEKLISIGLENLQIIGSEKKEVYLTGRKSE